MTAFTVRRLALVLTGGLLAAACVGAEPSTPNYEATVVAEGLLNPVGLAVLPTGELLVAEEGTGNDDISAGISIISGNRVDRLVDGLPSGRDSGDLSGVPMVGVSPDGSTVYTSHFGAEALLTLPTPSSKAVDAGAVIGPDDLRPTMTPLNRVKLTNAFRHHVLRRRHTCGERRQRERRGHPRRRRRHPIHPPVRVLDRPGEAQRSTSTRFQPASPATTVGFSSR